MPWGQWEQQGGRRGGKKVQGKRESNSEGERQKEQKRGKLLQSFIYKSISTDRTVLHSFRTWLTYSDMDKAKAKAPYNSIVLAFKEDTALTEVRAAENFL